MFDKGKELGESGLKWLKIHLANIAGNDKASFSERVKFVEDHYDDIYDSADNPLTVSYSAINSVSVANSWNRVAVGG